MPASAGRSRSPSAISTTSPAWESTAATATPRSRASSFAGIPPTKTCMNCHSQIWTNAQLLEPVRASYRDRRVAAVDAGQRPSRLRLLQSQHSRRQGRRLRDLPRPSRPDAADVPAGLPADGVVPGLPSRSGKNLRPRDQVFNMRYEQPTTALPWSSMAGASPIKMNWAQRWSKNIMCET